MSAVAKVYNSTKNEIPLRTTQPMFTFEFKRSIMVIVIVKGGREMGDGNDLCGKAVKPIYHIHGSFKMFTTYVIDTHAHTLYPTYPNNNDRNYD